MAEERLLFLPKRNKNLFANDETLNFTFNSYSALAVTFGNGMCNMIKKFIPER